MTQLFPERIRQQSEVFEKFKALKLSRQHPSYHESREGDFTEDRITLELTDRYGLSAGNWHGSYKEFMAFARCLEEGGWSGQSASSS